MPAIVARATSAVKNALTSAGALNIAIAAVSDRECRPMGLLTADQVFIQNAAFELAERSSGFKYPAVYVYCDAIENELKEKFRTFSGKARMVIEIRVSHDRIEDLTKELEMYTEAVTELLDGRRGVWDSGMYYGGEYRVDFGQIKKGGKNLVQSAKVCFPVGVSVR